MFEVVCRIIQFGQGLVLPFRKFPSGLRPSFDTESQDEVQGRRQDDPPTLKLKGKPD
jgi:hypothetical protein